MAELNVTPMLDLAFTLLIFFIITTPLMEGSIEINLPTATPTTTKPPDPDALKTVEVNRAGVIHFEGRPITLEGLERTLVRLRAAKPGLAVVIRADRDLRYQQVIDVFDALQRAKVTRLGLTHLDNDEPGNR